MTSHSRDGDGDETVQLSLTIKKSTLDALDDLYPHLLKPQHQLLAAVSEVEETRVQTRALLDFQGAAQDQHHDETDRSSDD